jgi:hypothetical protein
MLAEGLLLRDGFTQPVKVRVAAEFVAPEQQQQLTGNWSRAVVKLDVTPGSNLLLHSRPRHTWGKKFSAKCSAAAGYEALFPDLSQANMAAALGEQRREVGLQRCFVGHIGPLLVEFINGLEECQQVSVLGVTLKDLEQPGRVTLLTTQKFRVFDAQLPQRALQLASHICFGCFCGSFVPVLARRCLVRR